MSQSGAEKLLPQINNTKYAKETRTTVPKVDAHLASDHTQTC